MNLLKWSLYPFTLLYSLGVRVRNHLYNIEHFKSFEFQTNVISVGNLTVGGTGKTPMVEYLIRLFTETGSHKLATLSRGYGRKTKGFIKGDLTESDVSQIGDEPFQYLLKFGQEVNVFVGEERAWAIPSILYENPETEIILLDDAYQHRTVKPSLSILLTRHDQLFYNDMIIPSGRLREPRKEVNRADVIVVTKCPEDFSDQSSVSKEIASYLTKETPIFFTKVNYTEPVLFNGIDNIDLEKSKVVLISGLANSADFERYARSKYQVSAHLKFGDHHNYGSKDLEKITNFGGDNEIIYLTTEKDFVKLREFKKELRDLPFYYLPIEVAFLNNKSEFDKLIRQSVISYETPGGENE